MNLNSLWRINFALIVIIIIIGGVIIIIIRGPIPEPICIKCIANRITPWVIVEMIAGITSLAVSSRIRAISKRN